MKDKKTPADPIGSQLRKFARAYMHNDAEDLPTLATGIRDTGAFNPREVKLLIDAIKADVLQDLVTPPSPELRGLVLERLASRMLSESDATHEEARWAVDTWAKAFGSSGEETVAPLSEKPVLSWDDEDLAPAPNLSDLRAETPATAVGTSAPAVEEVVPNTAPPRFVPHPIPARQLDPAAADNEAGGLAGSRAWKHWIVVGAVVLVLALGLLGAIALPSFYNRAPASPHQAQPAP